MPDLKYTQTIFEPVEVLELLDSLISSQLPLINSYEDFIINDFPLHDIIQGDEEVNVEAKKLSKILLSNQ